MRIASAFTMFPDFKGVEERMIEEDIWTEELLKGAKLKKIKFPEFWQAAFRDKNAFFQRVFRETENYFKEQRKGEALPEGEEIRIFWHEHCLFCWEKFMTDMDTECFCTEDYTLWICRDCFEKYREKLSLILLEK